MKYYFITYQATNKQGSVSIWNQVTSYSPMLFIRHTETIELLKNGPYKNFVVINTCEISEQDYKLYKDRF